MPPNSSTRVHSPGVPRVRQAWTIARIELRRVFFANRSIWVYALAILPALIFAGHAFDATTTIERLSRSHVIAPAFIDGIREGESLEAVRDRLGEPAVERVGMQMRRVRQRAGNNGTTTHVIEPTVNARYVRLNVTRPAYSGAAVTRIYEFEVYGPKGSANLALEKPVTGSKPCAEDQGPEKAVNGSVTGGQSDRWCAEGWSSYLQVDLGDVHPVQRFVVKHASAGGEDPDNDTRDFNIQVSEDGRTYATVASSTGAAFIDERTRVAYVTYFDGRREARLTFIDGKLENKYVGPVLDFEEDRMIFAAIFQYFYLRLAIFFGCLGMFMYLFRGEMTNRTLHYWFLVPARREVLLAGKYTAGLIASAVIFGGGALLAFAAMVWPHDPVEVQAYWNAGGLAHMGWYTAAAVLGCVGYGSVFLAVGLFVRNPIIPAAVLLAWEGAAGILPHALQRVSILYYLQSLCPVPAPVDADVPALIQMLASPAAPASRPGAILGLVVLTAFTLWIAARAVRRMEISYGSEA